MKNGLFIGLVTLDFIYGVRDYPQQNQKIAASDYSVAAGGPATNAAVTFSVLGNQGKILGVVGNHAITQLIHADLLQQNVTVFDLQPSRSEPPPVSSIIVTQKTGDRTVVSINATRTQISRDTVPLNALEGIDIILIDGHQIPVSLELAEKAKKASIPVILDGGSWKPGLEEVLPLVDYAICSANFLPPECYTPDAVLTYLSQQGIANIAITQGEKPIQYFSDNQRGAIEVPKIQAVDTLGAGDIFHGAFCHFILSQPFIRALAEAAQVAATSCCAFGTRQWIEFWKNC